MKKEQHDHGKVKSHSMSPKIRFTLTMFDSKVRERSGHAQRVFLHARASSLFVSSASMRLPPPSVTGP
jgi:hypothetical protein